MAPLAAWSAWFLSPLDDDGGWPGGCRGPKWTRKRSIMDHPKISLKFKATPGPRASRPHPPPYPPRKRGRVGRGRSQEVGANALRLDQAASGGLDGGLDAGGGAELFARVVDMEVDSPLRQSQDLRDLGRRFSPRRPGQRFDLAVVQVDLP